MLSTQPATDRQAISLKKEKPKTAAIEPSFRNATRPTLLRAVLAYGMAATIGMLAFVALSFVNNRLEFTNLAYHCRWATLGGFLGLGFAATGHVVTVWNCGKGAAVLVGLTVGAVVGPVAMCSISATPPSSGALLTSAFLGGVFFARLGMRLADAD